MSYRDVAAMVWGEELGLGNSLYKWIKPGDRFRFQNSLSTSFHPRAPTYVKLPSGWYVDVTNPDGRKYRTGQRTAVLHVASAWPPGSKGV